MIRPAMAILQLLPTFVMAQSLANGEFLHFKIQLQPGYTLIDKSPPMMDFNLYEMQYNSEIIAHIYAGNHAKFKFNPAIHTRRFLSKNIVLVEPKSDQGPSEILLEFDGLEYKESDDSPWSQIHVFDISNNPKYRMAVITAFEHIQIFKRRIE